MGALRDVNMHYETFASASFLYSSLHLQYALFNSSHCCISF
jgi:hypothetical protein